MKLDRKFLFLTSGILFGFDFFYVIARNAVTSQTAPASDSVHTLFLLLAFSAFIAGYVKKDPFAERNPVQLIGKVVFAATVLLLMLGIVQLAALSRYTLNSDRFIPSNMSTLITIVFLGITTSTTAITIFLSFMELIFIKRRRNTKRNFLSLTVFGLFYVGSAGLINKEGLVPIDFEWIVLVAFLLLLGAMIINAFRFSWILVLTRKEKLVNLVLSFFGFVFFILLTVDAGLLSQAQSETGVLSQALLSYHPLVHALVSSVFLFGAIYMGIGFTSTLLHLPTAKEFDRKKTEISSLQNMSRLVTQVFDLDELVATTTHLALEVSEGDSAWLELQSFSNAAGSPRDSTSEDGSERFSVVEKSLRNIRVAEINELKLRDGKALQCLVLENRKPIILHDLQIDKRLNLSKSAKQLTGSMAMIPLSSHDSLIGILTIIKKNPYEFDKEIMNVLCAFADMVTIALENSRLIAMSMERQRFEQEMLVAQQMQRSLLPHLLPLAATYDVAARSIPAYEVGGDYYDVVLLDERHLGIIIGDVSGKGVSAALYMAQVKGIFQSLSSHHSSTRDVLTRMNDTLCKNMEKKSFISLLYGVLDIETGTLTFSRAGHCPLLYISDGAARFLRPNGMGLGLDSSDRFENSIEEETLHLKPNDVIVLYTDGVTETRTQTGEEFQSSRLAQVVEECNNANAQTIMTTIISSLEVYRNSDVADDDVTVLVLRWIGYSQSEQPDVSMKHSTQEEYTHE